jgi:hypothetical protein
VANPRASGTPDRTNLAKERSWSASALACYGVLWQKGAPDDPDRLQVLMYQVEDALTKL